jgi:hypothetical protein
MGWILREKKAGESDYKEIFDHGKQTKNRRYLFALRRVIGHPRARKLLKKRPGEQSSWSQQAGQKTAFSGHLGSSIIDLDHT